MTRAIIPDTNLPVRIIRFCEEYIVDGNGKQAAIRAGYSEHTAQEQSSRLLSKVKVKEYIDELKAKQTKRLEVTADKVLTNIVEISERCMQDVRPMKDRKGNPIMVYDKDGNLCQAYEFDANAALRANELLGKSINLFAESEGGTKTVNQTLIINVDRIELKEIMKELESEC